jgi:radical SAM protein with 4Fe4S-binding SPASM domain
MIITKVDRKNKFIAQFNTEDGFYVRSGAFDESGEDTNVDPFMTEYPELIDVGIMGHCEHTQYCTVGCYQGGVGNQKPNMKLEDYKSIIDQSKGKVFQIALGGHGDPNKHENFEEFLKATREANIVPNYTTSGLNLTEKEVELTKKYCGAVAVSWYRQKYTTDAIYRFAKAGCTTNIHFVLSNNTINEAIGILKGTHGDLEVQYINAIIFLMHKPVGCGSMDQVLNPNDPRVKEFFSLVNNQHTFKIGFDSCSVPAIVNYSNDINLDSVDTCEGSRWSCYISSDMILTPCSFDQEFTYGVSLYDFSIKEVWNGEKFGAFRSKLANSCPGCGDRQNCMGGCPLKQEIVLCERSERQ